MKRAVALTVAVLFKLVTGSAAAANKTAEGEFQILNGTSDQAGEISLRVRFSAPKATRIYSWRGHIDPILGYALTLRVLDARGRRLKVDRIPGYVPEVPHSKDVVETTNYEYPNPLRVRLTAPRGRPVVGCLSIIMTYDTRGKAYVRAGLTSLQIKSGPLAVCIEKQAP